MKKGLGYGVAMTALCLAGHAGAQSTAAPTQLVLGIVPQFPAVELQRRWSPVLNWLEQSCRLSIRVDYVSNIPAFEERFLAGQFDLAYMNPYHAVMAYRAHRYEPLVRDGQNMLKGVLTVKADGTVQRLQDLQGATIAFPSPNAFGASLYMRALLERTQGVRFTPYYAKTHSNAYRHVLKGEALAAGGVGSTLAAETPEVQSQLRVLYETPPSAPHPLVAHPRVNADQRRCITEQLTAAVLPQATRDWLVEIQMPKPMRAVYGRDYQPLEKLALESYVVNNAP